MFDHQFLDQINTILSLRNRFQLITSVAVLFSGKFQALSKRSISHKDIYALTVYSLIKVIL